VHRASNAAPDQRPSKGTVSIYRELRAAPLQPASRRPSARASPAGRSTTAASCSRRCASSLRRRAAGSS
jgi:hypothetical protein